MARAHLGDGVEMARLASPMGSASVPLSRDRDERPRAAYAALPERFVRKAPEPPVPLAAAGINKPEGVATTTQ